MRVEEEEEDDEDDDNGVVLLEVLCYTTSFLALASFLSTSQASKKHGILIALVKSKLKCWLVAS